jgi:dCMP deaminase
MASQSNLDEVYLKMSEVWASLSKAKRKQVGCLIVKDGAIISDGFNGTPKGFDNECEYNPDPNLYHKLITKAEVLHAESNAITKLAKSTQSSSGSTMYITISPCLDCAKLIIQADIKRVVFKNFYKNSEGIDLLKQANIEVVNYESR